MEIPKDQPWWYYHQKDKSSATTAVRKSREAASVPLACRRTILSRWQTDHAWLASHHEMAGLLRNGSR